MIDAMAKRRGRPPKIQAQVIEVPAQTTEWVSVGVQSADNSVFGLPAQPEPCAEVAENPVYLWEIPLDSDPTYTRRIEIEGAESVEVARATALKLDLTPGQSAWVTSYEPQAVRDTSAITMEHLQALRLNEKLAKENEALQAVKRVCAEYGIDIANPQQWIDQQMQGAEAFVKDAQDKAEAARRRLGEKIGILIRDMESAWNETGFAPPKPAPVLPPDARGLTIYTTDIDEAERRHGAYLPGANWIKSEPNEELSEQERAGVELLISDRGLLNDTLRTDMRFNEPKRAALRAALKRLRRDYASG